MLYNAFDIVQQGDLIKEFTLLVYDQQCFRHIVFHFHFLYFCGILNGEFHIRGL